jgi:hypothetical protein
VEISQHLALVLVEDSPSMFFAERGEVSLIGNLGEISKSCNLQRFSLYVFHLGEASNINTTKMNK